MPYQTLHGYPRNGFWKSENYYEKKLHSKFYHPVHSVHHLKLNYGVENRKKDAHLT